MTDSKKSEVVVVRTEISPIIEALLYCKNLVNNLSVKQEVKTMFEQFPESRSVAMELFTPLVQLEAELNAVSAHLNMERLHYYFDELFGGLAHPHGYTLANALMMPVHGKSEAYMELSEYKKELLDSSIEEVINRMHISLAVNSEIWNSAECEDLKSFCKYVNGLPVTDDIRFKIISSVLNYDDCIEELTNMLEPLLDTIKAKQSLYAPLIERYRKLYSGMTGAEISAQISVGMDELSLFDDDAESYELHPCLFGVGRFFSMCIQANTENAPIVSRTEINVLIDQKRLYTLGNVTISDIAGYVKALGDSTRMQILSMLRSEELYVQELTEKTLLSFTAVSHHMTKLMLAGLVTCERRGNRVYYSANVGRIKWLIGKLKEVLL